MEEWKNISVLILSKDHQFSESLKYHLEQNQLSEQFKIGSYEDVDKCLQNLNYDDKDDVIVFNYDEHLAEKLSQKMDEMLRDFTLIHRIPKDMEESKVRFVKAGVKEYKVSDKKPFKEITNLIKRVSKQNKVAKRFANVNYWIAAITIILIVIAIAYFFLI